MDLPREVADVAAEIQVEWLSEPTEARLIELLSGRLRGDPDFDRPILWLFRSIWQAKSCDHLQPSLPPRIPDPEPPPMTDPGESEPLRRSVKGRESRSIDG